MYKASIYNNYFLDGEKTYIWNSFTGALASFEQDTLHLLDQDVITEGESPFIDMLLHNGYIVDQNADEYQYVCDRSEEHLTNGTPERLNYVIAPTMACNYKCVYCFENGRQSFQSMTEKVASDILRFILQEMDKHNSLKEVHITWFGGEPLLQQERIKEISYPLINECVKRGVNYGASIITNGRYLTAETAKLLAAVRVNKVQISFDGTEKIYCEKKVATPEDYRTTLENIRAAAEYLHQIIVRINVGEDNAKDVYKLADILLGEYCLAGKIRLCPAFTVEGAKDERPAKYRRFAEFEKQFKQYVLRTYGASSYDERIPHARGCVCNMACRGSFCIGPKGELYKCEHHFGRKEYEVGDIYGAVDEMRRNAYDDLSRKTLQREACKSCPVFPVCMGGCPNSTAEDTLNFDCDSYRKRMVEQAVLPRVRKR